MGLRGLMRWVGAVLAAGMVAGPAMAQGGTAGAVPPPPQEPILRIEPGMHTAPIRRIAVDAACTLMATGSDDKTVRLWRLPAVDGKSEAGPELVRTLRVPVGPGDDGKVYAVAMAPDGSWVAAGGSDARNTVDQTDFVYVFETATGRVLGRLGPHAQAVNELAVSPDGTRLAATLGRGGGGSRVWDTRSWRLLGEDGDYGGQRSLGAAFDREGRLFTVAFDGHLRRYEAGADGRYRRTAMEVVQGGKEPLSVAVHPSGDRVAVGFTDSTAVEVYDAGTLKRSFAAATADVGNGDISSVAWSADGQRLYAGGRYDVGGPNPIREWPEAGRGMPRDLSVGPNGTIMRLLPCGGAERLAFGSADPSFGLIDAGGRRTLWQGPATPDMRDKLRTNFLVSDDGRRVRFGLGVGATEPVMIDLETEQVRDAPQAASGLAAPRTEGLPVRDWAHTAAPKLGSAAITLERYEMSRALAIAPDAKRFVLGTEWLLRAYDAEGAEQWQKAVPGTAWGANITGDGRVVVAAYGDGTIRWHRLSDGQELLALYVHRPDRRWVAWTPKGYYLASPGAESLIGWHVNRGWDEAPDFYPADRFREQFARPDIVKLVLEMLDEEKAIAEANRKAGRTRGVEDVRKIAPPLVVIQKPADNATFRNREVTIEYYAVSPTGRQITDVDVRINEGVLATRAAVPVNSRSGDPIRLTLTLPPQDVTVTLVAREGDRASDPAFVRLRWDGAKPGEVKLPRLRALFVGINAYQKMRKLNFAAKDAADLERFFKGQEKKAYAKVETRLLADAKRSDVIEGLEWLEKESQEGDVNILFLAGHGMTDEQLDYYFMTADSDARRPRATAVSKDEIVRTIKRRKGSMIVMLDTCHAGATGDAADAAKSSVDMNKVANELGDRTLGVFLYASALGKQLSEERADWGKGGNGAFTAALLEGLSGAADREKVGYIDSEELSLFVRRRVLAMTEERQQPVRMKPDAAPELRLASTR